MMNLTEVAARIDKTERERVDELYREWESGKEEFTPTEIFGSKMVAEILNDKPLAYYDSFDDPNSKLPLNCLLYSHVLVNVCPLCSCNSNPSLIKPYLERGIVLPILNADLTEYGSKFVDLITQYPRIGRDAFGFLSDASPDAAIVRCEHCYEKEWRGILKKIINLKLAKKSQKKYSMLLDAKSAMSDPSEREVIVLNQIKEAVGRGDIRSVLSLAQKGIVISKLKYPRMFEAIPQVDQDDLERINSISRDLGLPLDQATYELQEKELAIKGLNLDYDPNRPVDEYLDIILPRRGKINALIKELVEHGSQSERISRINDKLWEINRDVVASKSFESISFLTSLVTDNLSIIASLLVGAFVGYSSAEMFGCGIGGMGGVTIGTIAKKYAGVKIPNIPRRTVEWMKSQLESPHERMLSMILSKDIKTIQVWQLRRRIGETR